MNEKQAVESTYYDKCSVRRKSTTLSAYKVTSQAYATVHTDLPCALSKKELGNANKVTVENEINYNSILFLPPEYTIIAGDEITVTITANGEIRKYKAGEPMVYPTHQEVQLLRFVKA